MRFVIRMAVREIRASWRRLILFFLCIAIGVGGIVLLRSVVQDVRVAIARDARSMVAADVTMSTSRPWDEKARATVERRLAARPGAGAHRGRRDQHDGASGGRTPRRHEDGRGAGRPAGVSAVRHGGAQDGRPLLARAAGGPRRAACGPELLAQLESRVGDEILIGTGRFTVRGVLVVRARAPRVGVQLRTADPRRCGRPRDAPASWASAAASRATCSSSCPERAVDAARRRSCATNFAGSSSTSGRSAAPRITSGRTCHGRRTTSASSGS